MSGYPKSKSAPKAFSPVQKKLMNQGKKFRNIIIFNK